MTTAPTSLRIPSDGFVLDADLYLPATGKSNGRRPPIIVLGHGIGYMKSAGLKVFARHFNTLGLAALLFDYRGFGKSTGELREYPNAKHHIADFNNVLQYIRDGHVTQVDNQSISLWGYSLSGGVVLHVASQPQNDDVEAVVTLAPQVGLLECTTLMPIAKHFQLLPRSIADKLLSWLGLPALRIPLGGKPGSVGILTVGDSGSDYYSFAPNGKKDWTYGGYVPARVLLEAIMWRPMWHAANIKAAVLVLAAKDDLTTPLWAVKRNTRAIPLLQLESLPCGHFDMGGGRSFYQRALDLQTEFLKTKLGQ